MEGPFWKQKLQSEIAFLEVHFVSSRMIILDNIIFSYKKVFHKTFPYGMVIL